MKRRCSAALIASFTIGAVCAAQPPRIAHLVDILPPPTKTANVAQFNPKVTAIAQAPKYDLVRRQVNSVIGWESIDGSYRQFNCPSGQQFLASATYGGCCSDADDCSIATGCASRTLFFASGDTGTCANGCGIATWRQNLGDSASWRIYGCNPANRGIPTALYQNNPAMQSSSLSSSSSSSSKSSSSGSKSSSSSSSAISAAASSSSSSIPKQRSHVGAIVGGVVGGLAGLLFLIIAVVALLILRRRRKDEAQEADKFANSSMPPSGHMAAAVPVGKSSHYGSRVPTQTSMPVGYSHSYSASAVAAQQTQFPPPASSGAVSPLRTSDAGSPAFGNSSNYAYAPQTSPVPREPPQSQPQYDVASPLHSNAVNQSPASHWNGQGFQDNTNRYTYPGPIMQQSTAPQPPRLSMGPSSTGPPIYNSAPIAPAAAAPRYPGARTYAPDRTSTQGW